MKYIDNVFRLNSVVSRWMESIAATALLLITLITCVDVFFSKVFMAPVFGSLDAVMLAQTIAISFGSASTLIIGGHVAVELFTDHLPKTAKKAFSFLVELLCLFLFLVVTVRLFLYGYDLQLDREVSPTARVPLYPFAYGIAIATIPVCIELSLRIWKLFSPESSKTPSDDA